MLRVLAVSALLLLPVPSAHATLTAGAPVEVAARVIDAAPFDRTSPEVATNGDGFLSVWGDSRTGGPELRAARFDARGRLLDETGFRIAIGNGYWYSVASDGDDYVVTYDCTASMYAPSTCIAAVDPNGAVEHRATIDNATQASVASNGNGFLVTYLSTAVPVSTHVPLRALSLDADGNVAGTAIDVGASPYSPAIAANGDRYLIIWSNYSALYGAVVTGGRAGTPQQISRERPSWGPGPFSWSVASDGRDFLAVWQQNVGVQNSGYVTELRSSVVGPDGTPAEPRAVATPEGPWYPSVTWTGRDYFVTYTAGPPLVGAPYLSTEADTRLRRLSLSRTGERVSAPAPLTAGAGREGFGYAAWNGSTTLVLWQQTYRTGRPLTWSSFERIAASHIVAAALPDEAPVLVSRSVTWQRNVDASERVVVWEELVGLEQRRKVFVQPHGAAGRGFEVSSSPDEQAEPAVDSGLVVWIERPTGSIGAGTVRARRLDAGGQPFGDVLALGQAAFSATVSIASSGGGYLVAWESPSHDIVAVRLLGTGRLLDATPIVVADAPVRLSDPEVATDGSDYFVTWRREGQCIIECIPPTSAHGVVVGAAGTLLSAAVDLAPMWSGESAVVWNGSEYVFFWYGPPHDRTYDLPSALHARRIDRAGIVRDVEPRRTPLVANPLDVVWTGEHYALVSRSSAVTLAVHRLARDLSFVDTTPLGTTVPASPTAALAATGDGLLAAWQRRNEEGISRIVTTPLTEGGGLVRRRSAR